MGEKSKTEHPRKFRFSTVFTSRNLEVMKAAALSLAECPGSPWSPGGRRAEAGNSVGGSEGVKGVASLSYNPPARASLH